MQNNDDQYPDLRAIIENGHAVTENVIAAHNTGENYVDDLALESLLEFSAATQNARYRTYVFDICKKRGVVSSANISYAGQPFSCLTFELYLHTKDPAWLPVFIEQTKRWRAEAVRSQEGAIMHPRGVQRGGGHAILIDWVQCYSSRMAAAGHVTGDESYFKECVEQYRLHRELLRSPDIGLWSQGRGWLNADDSRLSPGAWSRGHGWLIRGLEKSLRYLPASSTYATEMTRWLREMADTLLSVQSETGMWHTLLNRPISESPPDSSGTGMIANHLARAWHGGVLRDTKYLAAAQRAFAALPRFVRTDGVILSASPGPGPLEREEPWLAKEFPAGDPHGTFALLFAAAAACEIRQGGRPLPTDPDQR